jgi:2-methylcitrate dehydratase PrpD
MATEAAPSTGAHNPTAELATWAAELTADRIPPAIRERTIDLLIDSVACALPADRAEEMGAVASFADVLGSRPETTVIGCAERRSPAGAALVNAYRITALTACDVYTPAHVHVTPEVVPPALAVAEERGASGADLLVGLAAGFEVATRVAAGLRYEAFRARGWHTPGVAGPFGGAAAVGRLIGLDPDRMRNALGLAGSQAAGTWAAWGTATVKFHQARAAISGLLAANLAATGFAAADDVLTNPDGGILNVYSDGGDPEAVVSGLGERWELGRISLRPWPGATPVQPVITGLFQLMQDGSLVTPSDASLRIFVAPSVHSQHARFRHPTGTFEAMLSIDYAAAAVMAFGRLGFDEFMPSVYGRPEIVERIDRQITLLPDPELTPLQCRLELGDPDPRIVVVTIPKGHPDDPASRALLAEKFHSCAAGVLDAARAAKLLATLEHLEKLTDVRELCAQLRTGEA